jgi:hypothetical protein
MESEQEMAREQVEKIEDATGYVCHIVFRAPVDQEPGRLDLATAEQYLQLGVITANAGVSFRPHVHLERTVQHENFRAQESWVVVRGLVEVTFFDDHGAVLSNRVLRQGDLSVSFKGGHGYSILEDALVYEFKTGPYLGQESDKRFLD